MTVTIETEFSETGQSEPWKNEVAKELNDLLQIALNEGEGSVSEKNLISIVQRVADFEEITVLKGEE